MWYDCQCDNCPQETKMTQTLTTIGHRTAFNNEQSPYRIVSYIFVSQGLRSTPALFSEKRAGVDVHSFDVFELLILPFDMGLSVLNFLYNSIFFILLFTVGQFKDVHI